jgi:hypothetical protein
LAIITLCHKLRFMAQAENFTLLRMVHLWCKKEP